VRDASQPHAGFDTCTHRRCGVRGSRGTILGKMVGLLRHSTRKGEKRSGQSTFLVGSAAILFSTLHNGGIGYQMVVAFNSSAVVGVLQAFSEGD
jgi:hypothetical protein